MQLIYYLPIITTIVAICFSWEVANRYRQRQGLHLLWWCIGIVCFGLGTLVESCVTLFGWHPLLFRFWYIAGALLGAAPLAQGTVYLLINKKLAHILAVFLLLFVIIASTFVFLTPLDISLVENGELSGKVIEWEKVRLFSIFLNVYAVFFLGGGAFISAWRFYKQGKEHYHRFIGNVLIVIGTFCAAAGGASARMGHTEVLYVAELFALLIIYLGYRVNIKQIK
ncbi:hypothetical protein [Candidatus Uabimicrobium sp. HlEnr_7]|uniref:hypothetical protein n=1 Tax=Candidatus Uabimicrobium helgolandensis TaxID=3095367 RepID=UPI003557AADA